jgi:ABC-type antimicrobial peptide transport system permease subunit
LFVRHGILLAAIGIGCGMVAAALLTRAMSSLLFGVSALDPITYAWVALALGATAVLASYLPARRAARIDPAEALRWEA